MESVRHENNWIHTHTHTYIGVYMLFTVYIKRSYELNWTELNSYYMSVWYFFSPTQSLNSFCVYIMSYEKKNSFGKLFHCFILFCRLKVFFLYDNIKNHRVNPHFIEKWFSSMVLDRTKLAILKFMSRLREYIRTLEWTCLKVHQQSEY